MKKTILQMFHDHDPNLPTPEELIMSILIKEQPHYVEENLKFYENNKNKIKRIIK